MIILLTLITIDLAFAGGLSAVAKEALMEASKSSDYTIQILSRKSGDLTQNVILLGEAHTRGDSAFELRNKIIQEFNLIGTEGLDVLRENQNANSSRAKFERIMHKFHWGEEFPMTRCIERICRWCDEFKRSHQNADNA